MGGCELFQQELKQHPIFTQTMLQNLSVLQMNRTALNIYVYEVTKNNPLVKSTKNFVPWNSTISPVSPDIIEQTLIQEQKLFDKIKEELILEIEESDSPILYLILGNLNAQGFLQIPLEQLFVNTTYDFEHVQKIHTYIMKSSLMGLGAKDSKEYLLFITKEQYGESSLEYKLASLLIQNNRQHLNVTKLALMLKMPALDIEKALQHLKTIPKTPIINPSTRHIYPDFIVQAQGDILKIKASDYLTPTIEVNDYHTTTYTKVELSGFLKEVEKLQKALELRSSTLQKHAEAIIIARSDFFLKTGEAPKEIGLKNIAEITGRHISTVSRALQNRYFLFEDSIHPFTELWTHKIGNSTDQEVKAMIIKIINNEDLKSPLSDSSITNILNKKGISIARRTVNKYRKELAIDSLYQRHPR